MTIEQERDIAVRALKKLSALGYSTATEALAAIKREQTLQALADEAQERGEYAPDIAAQASPVAQDDPVPHTLGAFTARFYYQQKRQPTQQECFDAGMRGGRDIQWPRPAAQPVGEAVAWATESNVGRARLLTKLSTIESEIDRNVSAHQAEYSGAQRSKVALYRGAPPVAQDQDAGLRIAHAEAVEKLGRLSAEVLGLRNAPEYQDSVRLDWVARHGASLRIDPKDERWYFVAPYRTKIDCVDEHRRFDSPRAAIDAAMLAEVKS